MVWSVGQIFISDCSLTSSVGDNLIHSTYVIAMWSVELLVFVSINVWSEYAFGKIPKTWTHPKTIANAFSSRIGVELASCAYRNYKRSKFCGCLCDFCGDV
uniref:Uncharacterized protein n=1 Tax=Glossina pallidipes TaxID=7398 RepID=A0A1A9Z591_GLOPL